MLSPIYPADQQAARDFIEKQRRAFDTDVFSRAWMVIPGTGGRYEVSGAGVVRLVQRMEPLPQRSRTQLYVDDERLLAPDQVWRGPTTYLVQTRRLVAAAFFGLPKARPWEAVVLKERTPLSAWNLQTHSWIPEPYEADWDPHDGWRLARAQCLRDAQWSRYVTNIRWATHSVMGLQILGRVPGLSPSKYTVVTGYQHQLTAAGDWQAEWPGASLEVDAISSYFQTVGQSCLDEAAITRYRVGVDTWCGLLLSGEWAVSFFGGSREMQGAALLTASLSSTQLPCLAYGATSHSPPERLRDEQASLLQNFKGN